MQLVMKSRIHTIYSHKTQHTVYGTKCQMERLVRFRTCFKDSSWQLSEYNWQEGNTEGSPLIRDF